MNTSEKVSLALSPYTDYCEGYGNTGASGNSYFLGVNVGIGVTEKKLGHDGSSLLDEINAFDLAETDAAYIGQLNMSVVSSFCGPQGVIWGYDVAKHDSLFEVPTRASYPRQVTHRGQTLEIFDGNKLVEATTSLFGTVDARQYPIRPGSHVPFAAKSIKTHQAGIIYSALAIGIAARRDQDACLLMEDAGFIGADLQGEGYEDRIREKMARSILEIGHNQRVNFQHTFIAIRSKQIETGQVGCALVAAPYFTLARNALPTSDITVASQKLAEMSLSEWKSSI